MMKRTTRVVLLTDPKKKNLKKNKNQRKTMLQTRRENRKTKTKNLDGVQGSLRLITRRMIPKMIRIENRRSSIPINVALPAVLVVVRKKLLPMMMNWIQIKAFFGYVSNSLISCYSYFILWFRNL